MHRHLVISDLFFVSQDQTVDFLQEDNICYRAMPGKKLLLSGNMEKSQFSG